MDQVARNEDILRVALPRCLVQQQELPVEPDHVLLVLPMLLHLNYLLQPDGKTPRQPTVAFLGKTETVSCCTWMSSKGAGQPLQRSSVTSIFPCASNLDSQKACKFAQTCREIQHGPLNRMCMSFEVATFSVSQSDKGTRWQKRSSSEKGYQCWRCALPCNLPWCGTL